MDPKLTGMRRRYYRNLQARSPSPPRRSSITGTNKEIADLRVSSRHLTGKTSYHKRVGDLYDEHLIQDYHKAGQAFASGEYQTCSDRCFGILAKLPLSDTIKAKTYMLLAKPEVIDSPHERAHYAELAKTCWDTVIGRVGYCHTRFPVGKAREQRQIAQQLLDQAWLDRDHTRPPAVNQVRDNKENMTPSPSRPSATPESPEL